MSQPDQPNTDIRLPQPNIAAMTDIVIHGRVTLSEADFIRTSEFHMKQILRCVSRHSRDDKDDEAIGDIRELNTLARKVEECLGGVKDPEDGALLQSLYVAKEAANCVAAYTRGRLDASWL